MYASIRISIPGIVGNKKELKEQIGQALNDNKDFLFIAFCLLFDKKVSFN